MTTTVQPAYACTEQDADNPERILCYCKMEPGCDGLTANLSHGFCTIGEANCDPTSAQWCRDDICAYVERDPSSSRCSR